MISINFNSKSSFVPHIELKMFNMSISEELRAELKNIVLKEEYYILNNFPPLPNSEHNKDWITSRLWYYNFLDFDYDAVRELKTCIYKSYCSFMHELNMTPETVYVQCWVNIIKNNGRYITPHNHASGHSVCDNSSDEFSYLSGNLCIQTENTNTYFKHPFLNIYYPIPNIDGEMILFPSFVTHYTDKNLSENARITISFDLILKEYYDKIDGTNYRVLG